VTALVHSELLKIRTTRGWYAYLGVLVLLVGIAVSGEVGTAADPERSTVALQVHVVDAAGISALLALILGITVITTEFRHGTITPTLLASPHRELVVGGKAIACGSVGVLFALLGLVVAAAVGLVWLLAVDADIHLLDREVGAQALQVILSAALWGLIGLAIGALVQSQVAALVGTLVWMFLVETLLIGVLGLIDLDAVGAYLPFRALDAADGMGGEDLLSYWAGVGVSLAWIAALGAAGAERLRRRDIT
jgi:ABC-type transport system involved in multi-copper enzyme maturation permease subunit